RTEIIEKSKGFVEDCKKDTRWHGRSYLVLIPEGSGSSWICDVRFEVNENKRSVTALLYWKPNHYKKGELKAKGIAKCDPSDVFNEHIGKAIALGRALGLDVSEFEQAVQPNEVVVGMHVFYKKEDRNAVTIHDDIKGIKIISETYLSTAKGQFKQGNCQI